MKFVNHLKTVAVILGIITYLILLGTNEWVRPASMLFFLIIIVGGTTIGLYKNIYSMFDQDDSR